MGEIIFKMFKVEACIERILILHDCALAWLVFIEKARGQPELNRWPLDLQSNALPLSYIPMLKYTNIGLSYVYVNMRRPIEINDGHVVLQSH